MFFEYVRLYVWLIDYYVYKCKICVWKFWSNLFQCVGLIEVDCYYRIVIVVGECVKCLKVLGILFQFEFVDFVVSFFGEMCYFVIGVFVE